MTAPVGKTVIVLGGFTGPTGTFKQVNILGTFTGPTGTYPIWNQATGSTGPNGTFESVINIGPTGPSSKFKTVIIPGFSVGGGGSTLDPATMIGGTLSNGNLTWQADAVTNNAGAQSTTQKTTGKWYYEVTIVAFPGSNLGGAGAKSSASALSTCSNGLGSAGASGYFQNGPIFVNGTQPGNITMNGGARTPQVGDVIGIGIDADAKTITYKNITAGGTVAGPTTMVTETNYVAAVFTANNATQMKVTVNFGATAFAGTPFAGYTAWG